MSARRGEAPWRLAPALATPPPTAYLPWQGWRLATDDFLVTRLMEMVVHSDADWSQLDDKMSVNQDAVVIPLLFMGNVVCSNRALQGLLLDAT